MRWSPVERVDAANCAGATIRSTRHRTIAAMPGQRQPLVSSDATAKKGRSSRPSSDLHAAAAARSISPARSR
ncbi:hypothetical protein ACRPM7_24075, partial [Burkholderia vietnamiensis]|uniref:hypothetical protein n=1 Tax=Burkholderia vietnamiensis TaxID=60552 RepID=UPI001AD99EE2